MGLNVNQKTYLKHLAAAGDMLAIEAMALDASGRGGLLSLGAAVAKNATVIHAAILATTSIDPVAATASPAQPRNVSSTTGGTWDGGNTVITGTDQWGHTIGETIVNVAGTTVYGTKVYKTVLTVAHTVVGSAGSYSVGTGDKLGLMVDLTDTMGMGLVQATAGAANTPEALTVDPSTDAVTFTTVPDGTKVLNVLVNF